MKSVFPKKYILFQCGEIGKLFVWSAKQGDDSEDFCYKFMTSQRGADILNDELIQEYCGESFMYDGLAKDLQFKKGDVYDSDVLYFTGFLYKYWASVRGSSAREIYALAPISIIAERYEFYHTQGWDYVIDDIISRPYNP